jgi:hypothetical protein
MANNKALDNPLLMALATQVNSAYGYDFYHCSAAQKQAAIEKIEQLKAQGDPASQALAAFERQKLINDRVTLHPNLTLGTSLLRKMAAAELFGKRLGWAKSIPLAHDNNNLNYFVFKYHENLYYLDLKLFIDRCFELKRRLLRAQREEAPLKEPHPTDPLFPLFKLYEQDKDFATFIVALNPSKKNYEAYGLYIKKKFKRLGITHYGWANAHQKSFLIPSRAFTVIEKMDVSAPALTAANIFVNQTPNLYPWTLIGDITVIAANMLYIPWIVYGLHQRLEISAYQYKYNGRNPATNGMYMEIVRNDALIITLQSLACTVFGSFIMDPDLIRKVGSLTDTILGEVLSRPLPAEIKFAIHASMAMLCGTILGFAMVAIGAAGTRNDPRYPKDIPLWKSFAIGFFAGISMYVANTCTAPTSGVRFLYELLLDPLVATGLHITTAHNRYTQTPDEASLPRNDIQPSLLADELNHSAKKVSRKVFGS